MRRCAAWSDGWCTFLYRETQLLGLVWHHAAVPDASAPLSRNTPAFCAWHAGCFIGAALLACARELAQRLRDAQQRAGAGTPVTVQAASMWKQVRSQYVAPLVPGLLLLGLALGGSKMRGKVTKWASRLRRAPIGAWSRFRAAAGADPVFLRFPLLAPPPEAPAPQGGRWYFGWNIVAMATVLVLLSVGLRLAPGPFFLPVIEDLGFSRSLFSSIVALSLLVYGMVMPGVGWLTARLGTRAVVLTGTALILSGGLWTAMAHDVVTFTLAFAVVLSLGLALVSPVTLTQIVSTWFVRQRGMALFFLSTGGMAGLAVVTPALTWAVDLWGWRWALAAYVLLLALVAVPGTLLVMVDQPPAGADGSARATPVPRRVAQARYGLWSALASRPFWLITIGLLANGYSMTLLGTHGIPMLVDHGFSAQTAAYGIGLIGLVAIAGTLVLGRMADRFPRRYILAAIYFVRGAAFVALMLVVTRQGLYGVAFVGGLVWAGSMAVSSAIMADIYGVRLISVLYGVAYLCQQLAGMLAAWLGGWGFEVFGTHWISFGGSVAILLVGGATALMLPDARARLAAAAAQPPV